jgi:hypothetical protein
VRALLRGPGLLDFLDGVEDIGRTPQGREKGPGRDFPHEAL